MAERRFAAGVSCAALMITAAACSTQASVAPTAARHGTTLSNSPATSTTVPAPTTTLPSATPTTVVAPVAQAPGWTGSLTTLPPGGGFTSLSCISDTFCVAVGGGANAADSSGTTGSGVSVSWDGAAWSEPSVYYAAPAVGPTLAPVLPAVACTGGPFCMIVDGSGHVSTGDGTNWSVPSALVTGPPLPANPSDPGPGHAGSRSAAVACPTSTFCAVVDNTGHTYTLRNGTWLPPLSFDDPPGSGAAAPTTALYQAGVIGVWCSSSSSCIAVVGTSILDWDGTTWHEEPVPWTAAPGAATVQAGAVACPTSTLCALVHDTGVSYRITGKSWSPLETVDPQGGLDSISCPTTSFCLAADHGGSVVTWNGSSWSAPQKVIPAAIEYTGDPTTVSCTGDGFCMVMNGDGDYATYTPVQPPAVGVTPASP